jgi:hypothetical protein
MNGTYRAALSLVGQSILIHPDWDIYAHMSFLESEGFDVYEEIAYTSNNKTGKVKLLTFIGNWIADPQRCIKLAVELSHK